MPVGNLLERIFGFLFVIMLRDVGFLKNFTRQLVCLFDYFVFNKTLFHIANLNRHKKRNKDIFFSTQRFLILKKHQVFRLKTLLSKFP